VDKLLVVDVAQSLAARVERAVLGQRNHVIGGLAHLLRAGEGGLDLAVADQLGGECTQQRLALVSRLVELAEARAVALQRGWGRERAEPSGRPQHRVTRHAPPVLQAAAQATADPRSSLAPASALGLGRPRTIIAGEAQRDATVRIGTAGAVKADAPHRAPNNRRKVEFMATSTRGRTIFGHFDHK